MKKLAFTLFLFSFLLGYSQNDSTKIEQGIKNAPKTSSINSESNTPPNSTQAQDWNSSRSNKTSKTSRTENPNGNTPLPDTERIGRDTTVGDYGVIHFSSGISTPSSSFSSNAYAENGTYFELSGAYYFSKFGVGLSLGSYTNPTDSNLENLTNSLNFSTTNSTEDWKVTYYGFGPEFTTSFNKIKASFLLRTGIMSIKPVTLKSSYNENIDIAIPIYSLTTNKTSKVSYFSTAIKIGYTIAPNLNIFASVDYLSALSNELTITEKTIVDANGNGIIDLEDLLKFDAASVTFDETVTTIKPQTTNFGIGFSYNFGNNTTTVKRKRPGRTTYSNITLERNQAKDDGNNENNSTRAIDHNASRSNTTASKTDSKDDGDNENNTARRGKRKAKKECLKNGGSFWENGDGSYHCMMPLSTAKEGANTNNELFRSKKRKCFKAGGQWVTNSHGSFCWNPSATTRVYGPGDAHYGSVVFKNKKQKANVEVRGWNPKGKKQNKLHEENNMQGENPLYNGKERVSIILTNPAKEKVDKKNKQGKLINVLPKNNSNFKNASEIKNFSWKLIGNKIANPRYIIEVIKISSSKQTQQTYISKTTKTTINSTAIFKKGKLSDGNYSWKVTETTTGISSNPSYFTMTQCEIDFTISNEEIECLGYEGENRKFKICFDSTYSSSSGDLTFTSPNGLTVFDQTYSALTYNLVGTNLTLVSQNGTTVSTVNYCFEVIVPSSVTSIGFGLQGDDLDPSPIVCQPGASAIFDELPSCLCNECEEVQLSFDDFNITPNGASGNQFNFNGSINVNVPIYGIEFQIQSYTYSSNPSACSEGVSNLEESGMILMPGTSINGSTSLQLFNETSSGSINSNNNATKDIKYTSNTPLTGPIPINLTIGLPGPITGLDPSCCVIDYTVCIKVKIFYEEGNCKSCVFTHCFQFNNQ